MFRQLIARLYSSNTIKGKDLFYPKYGNSLYEYTNNESSHSRHQEEKKGEDEEKIKSNLTPEEIQDITSNHIYNDRED